MDKVLGLARFSSMKEITIWQLNIKITVTSAIEKNERILSGFMGT